MDVWWGRSVEYVAPVGRPVEPSGKLQRCDTMNGNCVLIPREVAQSVGNISPEFTHKIGDMDYGLRARAKGFPLWVAPTYIGECSRNPPPLWVNPEAPLKTRLKVLRSPKGLSPAEWIVYARRHAGIRWPLYWLTLYMRALLPGLWRWQVSNMLHARVIQKSLQCAKVVGSSPALGSKEIGSLYQNLWINESPYQ